MSEDLRQLLCIAGVLFVGFTNCLIYFVIRMAAIEDERRQYLLWKMQHPHDSE